MRFLLMHDVPSLLLYARTADVAEDRVDCGHVV